MDDVDETAARLGELLAKATKGVWEIDTIKNEGSYGNGPDCVEGFESYKIIAGSGNSLLDSLNSETAEVHEDGPGELGEYHAWDDVALHNFELIAAMKNALPALLSERAAMKAEIETLRTGQQWRGIESAPMWGVAVVTNGQNFAIAQKAETDFGGHYWSVDPDQALEWEPKLYIPCALPELPPGEGHE